MRVSSAGFALIQEFEGYRALPYLDAAGLPTIGYGHLLTPATVAQYPDGINEADAVALLEKDVAIAAAAVMRWIATPLTQNQFDALVSFTFNLGAAVLQRSTLRRVINRGEHAEAPRQILRFVWAGGRQLPGLIRRRQAEANHYRVTENIG